jgi:hypothetical protein
LFVYNHATNKRTKQETETRNRTQETETRNRNGRWQETKGNKNKTMARTKSTPRGCKWDKEKSAWVHTTTGKMSRGGGRTQRLEWDEKMNAWIDKNGKFSAREKKPRKMLATKISNDEVEPEEEPVNDIDWKFESSVHKMENYDKVIEKLKSYFENAFTSGAHVKGTDEIKYQIERVLRVFEIYGILDIARIEDDEQKIKDAVLVLSGFSPLPTPRLRSRGGKAPRKNLTVSSGGDTEIDDL